MPIYYKNIVKGKEVSITAQQYEDNGLLDSSIFVSDFLAPAKSLIESFEQKDYGNGTSLFTVKYKEVSTKICILYGPMKNSGTSGKEDKRVQILPCTDLYDDAYYVVIGGYNTQDNHLYCMIKESINTFISKAQSGTTYSSLWFNYDDLLTTSNKGFHTWVDGAYRTVRGFTNAKINPIHQEIIAYFSNMPQINLHQKSSVDLPKEPLQRIYYGAPGTGKSHETNRVTREYRDTIRTTFHPDSDYSTFVGAYKPTTTEEFMYGLNGGNTVQYKYDGIPLKTTKIVYKFIPQAFIKAYIQAWKKMAKMTIATHATTIAETILKSSTDPKLSWKITKINDQDIYLESCYKLDIENFKKLTKDLWGHAWEKGIYDQTIFTSFQRHAQTVCNWICQNLENNNFEEGWDKFIAELNNGTLELKVDPFTTRKCKTYFYHIDGDTIIINANLHTTQDAIGTCFEQEKDPTNFQQAVANCLKIYNQNNLEDAWQMLEENLNNSGSHNSIDVEPQFLVIEEINRGNCAQIFGDLFQLLDRTKNGFSEYPIEADEDISKYIKKELETLIFNPDIIDYINQQFVDGDKNPQTYDIDGKRVHVLNAILNGKILVLPSNLYIWATMNTSDQSLFPIDSAFKRRWDWTYMPIKEAKDKNYKIVLSGSNIEYNWWDFISAINNVINEVTSSEDKKLGYFFCKPCDDKNITASQFVNKVIFYLWNDVLKDYEMPKEFEYGETKKKEDSSKSNHMSFNDFYTDQEKCIRQLMENLGVKPIAEVVKTEPTTDDASTTATSELATDDATASTAAIGTDESTEQTLF